MKKFFVTALALTILIFSAQVQAESVKVDYGKSKIFSRADMIFCISTIQETLDDWGCTLKNVRYVGDEISNSKENIDYMNELAESRNFKKNFTKCLVFKTDFLPPPCRHDGEITAWKNDSEYHDYTWYFGFYKVDGQWKLLTSGY